MTVPTLTFSNKNKQTRKYKDIYRFVSSWGDVLGVDFVESNFRFLTIGTFDDGCVNDFGSVLPPVFPPNTESELTTIDSVKFDVVNFWFDISLDGKLAFGVPVN